jgi:lipoate-protein ligase B
MQCWSLPGIQSYEDVRALQLKLVELRASDEIPDTVLFLEHEPVITQGRGLQFTGSPRPRHMPVPVVLPPGMTFAESERGGDLTYHGPGQLVIYPILKLDGNGWGPKQDIGGFIRKLERVLIEELASWGGQGEYRDHATGVWSQGRKVASLGIAVRKWVTYHGMAINCVNDMKPFHLISPCGFSAEVMTRLQDLALPDCPIHWDSADWREQLEVRLIRRFGLERIEQLNSLPVL